MPTASRLKLFKFNPSVMVMLAVLTVLFVYFFSWLLGRYEDVRADYMDAERQMQEVKLDNVINTNDLFARYIFDQAINKKEVLEILDQAYRADPAEQDLLRRQLYNQLVAEYEQMVEFNFRQLHFHFPDGHSFLRFNNPAMHGDNLFHDRESIRIVGEEKSFVHGFEAGRTFYGYRFVYPLFYEGVFIGSFDIGISLDGLIKTVNQRYPLDSVLFMINKESLHDFNLEMQQDEYLESLVFDNNFIESEGYIYFYVFSNHNNSKIVVNDEVVEQIRESMLFFKERGEQNEKFSVQIVQGGKGFILHFILLENVSNEPDGYYLSFTGDQRLGLKQERRNRELLLLTAAYLSLISALFIYNHERAVLKKMAVTDKLTGIHNRHEFSRLAEKEFSRSKRYNLVFCLLLIDIDLFKSINDTYGHATGDAVLKDFSVLVDGELRDTDLFARWGGEEFMILMPETTLEKAEVVAERLRYKVENFVFSNVEHSLVRVTISVGVTENRQDDNNFEQVVSRTDRALYRAKEGGRNRVVAV